MLQETKRANGQYFTESNPFENRAFHEWAAGCNLAGSMVLEPFAGSNNLITMLQGMGLAVNFASYDIEPKDRRVKPRDTIADFPVGFDVCITNPPYLARNSARRRGISFPDTSYDDLYKLALDRCLSNCRSVAVIIPASFLNSGLFRNRLSHYILLNSRMFADTDHPVCLALFKEKSNDAKIYEGTEYLGMISQFEKKIPNSKNTMDMKFNDRFGRLGLVAIDNTTEPSIRFCYGDEIDPSRVGISSRSLTRISLDCDVKKSIARLNDRLMSFREETHDLLLTPFKGLRKDRKYRRRLDFSLARKIINEAAVC
ncbi:MAG: hypothetical protein LBL52_00830 [Rickettsiales bacterium]|jgi:uncharacterized protein YchJ|nr:hypothetical protein [Rickettsiales bacterium]